MLIQAAGLALLAALNPAAVLAVAVFLGTANPHRTVLLCLIGAIIMTAVMAAVIYIALRAGGVQQPTQRPTRYGLRLGLGLLMLIAVAFMRWRARRQRSAPKQKAAGDQKSGGGLLGRLLASPKPRQAFIVGVFVYTPSAAFIAAVQLIATARVGTAAAVGDLIVIVGITIVFVWLPLIFYLVMPERTSRMIMAFNNWLRVHGRTLVEAALLVGGILLTLNGLLGLTGVIGSG
jgi:hypothetical protein